MIVRKFVYLLLLLLCFLILFSCFYLCLFIGLCLFLLFVFCFAFLFFWDMLLNTYVMEAVSFNDLSMILVNLWET